MRAIIRFTAMILVAAAGLYAQTYPAPKEADLKIDNYKFVSGATLPQLTLHYVTVGTPKTDSAGHVTNAVMVLHGTGGSGHQFLNERFAGVLFGPGQLLDASKYFIILPDDIGHGHSSKPSDGLHARFPEYSYSDMVDLEHRLVASLKVQKLRLLMGTSMGCMHSWMWLERYPSEVQAAMPLACLPVEIAGRNRMWRKMTLDAIRTDPEWKGGDYTKQPRGLTTALDMLLLAGSAPLYMQAQYPTREKADAYVEEYIKTRGATTDANDLWYAVNSSRDYDPSKGLADINIPIVAINSADDFINPPELGIFQREVGKVKSAKVVLLPITEQTRGHGTHTLAAIWKGYLEELLAKTGN
jgi:homoserine O-acetyltransferase/O-succinyltransferase